MALKSYEILFKNGKTKIIDIDEEWKITFGPMVPGSKSAELCLRIYESKEKQRALFRDVIEFRDMSIQMYDSYMENEIIAAEQQQIIQGAIAGAENNRERQHQRHQQYRPIFANPANIPRRE